MVASIHRWLCIQAAWIVDETDDDNDTDCENESMDSMVLDKDEQGDDNVEEASLAGDGVSVSFTLKDYDEHTQTDMMYVSEKVLVYFLALT